MRSWRIPLRILVLMFITILIEAQTAPVCICDISQIDHRMESKNYSDYHSPPLPAAHDLLWNYTFGTPDAPGDGATSVVECYDGGFAITGWVVGPGMASYDLWLIRTDSNGHQLWNRSFNNGGPDGGYALVECSDFGFAIVGSTSTETSGNDVWLIRTDKFGNHVWNQTFGGPGNDEGWSVVECSEINGFAIAGFINSGANDDDMWLIRTDVDGHHLWNKTFGGPSMERGYGLVECENSDWAIIGYTNSSGVGKDNAWLVRTDATGNHLWNRTYVWGCESHGFELVECQNLDLAITGETRSCGQQYTDMWLIRTDPNGNQLWNRTYGGAAWERGNAVIECADGGFAITGHTWSFGAGESDVWLVRTDATGNHLWNRTYGGNRPDTGWNIKECRTGGFVIAGNTMSFGEGGGDAWILRIPEDAPPTWITPPTNRIIEFGIAFHYELDATDSSGLGTWWLSGSTYFSITQEGIITNTTTLPVGVYNLQVRVTDIYENLLTQSFTVTVQDTTPPIWVIPPTSQYLDYGETLDLPLEVMDLAGIDHWTINDTSHFAISSTGPFTGHFTSKVTLLPGLYGVNITVYDPSNNKLSDSFTVTVKPATTTPLGLEVLAAKLTIIGTVATVVFAFIGIVITKEFVETKQRRIILLTVGVIITVTISVVVWILF